MGGGRPADRENAGFQRAVAERFAPRLRFDADELWYPTDPRAYVVADGGRRVTSGFRALNRYTARRERAGEPPNPTVFHRVVGAGDGPAAESDLLTVSYWFYYAFDQFASNFHWHDSEAYHVLCDAAGVGRDADAGAADAVEPVVRITDPHADAATNAEVVDRVESPPDRLTLYAELGAHALAPGTGAGSERPAGGWRRDDVTNRALALRGSAADRIEGIRGTDRIVDAYGLPREEAKRYPPRATGQLAVDLAGVGRTRAARPATPDRVLDRPGIDRTGLLRRLARKAVDWNLSQALRWYLPPDPGRPVLKRALAGLGLERGYRTPYLDGRPLVDHPGVDAGASGLLGDPGPERSPDPGRTFVPPGGDGPVTYRLRHTDCVERAVTTFTDPAHTPELEYGFGPFERLIGSGRMLPDGLGIPDSAASAGGFRRSIADPWTRDWWNDPTAAVASERTAELLRDRFGVAAAPERGRVNAALVRVGDAAPAGDRDRDPDPDRDRGRDRNRRRDRDHATDR